MSKAVDTGVKVWIRNPNSNSPLWLQGEVVTKISHDDGSATITAVDNNNNSYQIRVSIGNEEAANLKLRNQNISTKLSISDNLINLPYLNEPEMLTNLQQRFEKSWIYTYTGPILIAINPLYTVIPDSHCEELFDEFIQTIIHNNLTGSNSKKTTQQHAILISGESGSGKTECTKIILKYFLQLQSRLNIPNGVSTSHSGSIPSTPLAAANRNSTNLSHSPGDNNSILHKLLHAQQVLKGFGNAKTSHSQNSSRFGQYIHLELNAQGYVLSSRIQTHLLENIRVVHHQKGEQNFHIFYEFLCGLTTDQLRAMQLEEVANAWSSNYISQGRLEGGGKKTPKAGASAGKKIIPPTSDEKAHAQQEYQILLANMKALGFADSELELINSILAGLIHFGDIQFVSSFHAAEEGSDIVPKSFTTHTGKTITQLELIATLCEFPVEDLQAVLSKRVMVSPRGERLEMRLKPEQAIHARDAVAKLIYLKLFLWITQRINEFLEACAPPQPLDASGSYDDTHAGEHFMSPTAAQHRSTFFKANTEVGILDIFGFDSFDINSFEQLLINYANEALQQQFNQQIFKFELEEYAKEQIEFEKIEFSDNQDCMELIGLGIFRILDDQIKLPNPNDSRAVSQLYKEFLPTAQGGSSTSAGNKRFQASSAQKPRFEFSIEHFAGCVAYASEGFIEKNKDELPSHATVLLTNSENPILRSMMMQHTLMKSESTDFSGATTPGRNARPNNQRNAPSAVTQFKYGVNTLIREVSNTIPHYIRCINPLGRSHPLLQQHGKPTNGAIAVLRSSTSLPPQHASVQFDFDEYHVAEQLRYNGILEAIRVARSGFPIRYVHFDFLDRYSLLLVNTSMEYKTIRSLLKASTSQRNGIQEMCTKLVTFIANKAASVVSNYVLDDLSCWPLNIDPNNLQIGLTKVFLKRQEHDILEHYRGVIVRIMSWRLLTSLRSWAYRSRMRIRHQENSVQRKFREAEMTKQRVIEAEERAVQEAALAAQQVREQELAQANQIKQANEIKQAKDIQKRRELFAIIRIQKFVRRVLGKRKHTKRREFAKRSSVIVQTASTASIETPAGSADEEDTNSVSGGSIRPGSVALNLPSQIVAMAKRAKQSRVSKNLSHKILQYKKMDEILLREINQLIAAKKLSDEILLIQFNMNLAKKMLIEWANTYQATLRVKTIDLAQSIDYGYNLLIMEKLISASATNASSGNMFGRAINSLRLTSPDGKKATSSSTAATGGAPTPTKGNGAPASTHKPIDKDHKVFRDIYKIIEKIKDVIALVNLSKSSLEDRVNNTSKSNENFIIASLQNMERMVDFCRILYQYYTQYIALFIKEYGEDSTFKTQCDKEVSNYLRTLYDIVEKKQPLLQAERLNSIVLHTEESSGSTSQGEDFPTTISIDSLPGITVETVNMFSTSHTIDMEAFQKKDTEKVVFKLITASPGIEYTINCFYNLLAQETLMYPIRLIKLVGKNMRNYGKSAFYQASTSFSEDSLKSIIKDPVLDIPCIDRASYSISFLTCLLCGILKCKPEDFMVKRCTPVTPSHKHGSTVYKIIGMNNTIELQNQIIQTISKEEQISTGQEGIHALFQLTALFYSPIDSSIVEYLLTSPDCLPEETISSWLRELYLQNKRYDSLLSSGFSNKDLEHLAVPITLPQQIAKRVYHRFQQVIATMKKKTTGVGGGGPGVFTATNKVTHYDLLVALYPALAELYHPQHRSLAYPSASTNIPLHHLWKPFTLPEQHPILSPVKVRPSAAAAGGGGGLQRMKSRILNKQSFANVEEIAAEFMKCIDFSPFVYEEKDLFACGNISDNLSFLPSLWLRRVSEEQLVVMFGGLIETAYRAQQRAQGLSSSLGSNSEDSVTSTTTTSTAKNNTPFGKGGSGGSGATTPTMKGGGKRGASPLRTIPSSNSITSTTSTTTTTAAATGTAAGGKKVAALGTKLFTRHLFLMNIDFQSRKQLKDSMIVNMIEKILEVRVAFCEQESRLFDDSEVEDEDDEDEDDEDEEEHTRMKQLAISSTTSRARNEDFVPYTTNAAGEVEDAFPEYDDRLFFLSSLLTEVEETRQHSSNTQQQHGGKRLWNAMKHSRNIAQQVLITLDQLQDSERETESETDAVTTSQHHPQHDVEEDIALILEILECSYQETKDVFSGSIAFQDAAGAIQLNRFGNIVFRYPTLLMSMALELASRGVFNQNANFLPMVLIQPSLYLWEELIFVIIQRNPVLVMIPNVIDHYLPCDRLKQQLPSTTIPILSTGTGNGNKQVSVKNNNNNNNNEFFQATKDPRDVIAIYQVMAAMYNATKYFYAIHPGILRAATTTTTTTTHSMEHIRSLQDEYHTKLRKYDVLGASITSQFATVEEELVFRAVRYGFLTAPQDIQTGQYSFSKTIKSLGNENSTPQHEYNLIQCCYWIAAQGTVFPPAIHAENQATLQCMVKVLQGRLDTRETTKEVLKHMIQLPKIIKQEKLSNEKKTYFHDIFMKFIE